MAYEDEMLPMDETWEDVPVPEGSGATLFTDGTHQAKVTISRVIDHETFGYQWEIEVRGADSNTGQQASLRKWSNLLDLDEQSMGYLKKDFQTLGYTGKPSGLKAACESGFFDDLPVEIYVKSKRSTSDPTKTFSNLYFNRSYPRGEQPWTDEPVAAPTDDIPF